MKLSKYELLTDFTKNISPSKFHLNVRLGLLEHSPGDSMTRLQDLYPSADHLHNQRTAKKHNLRYHKNNNANKRCLEKENKQKIDWLLQKLGILSISTTSNHMLIKIPHKL